MADSDKHAIQVLENRNRDLELALSHQRERISVGLVTLEKDIQLSKNQLNDVIRELNETKDTAKEQSKSIAELSGKLNTAMTNLTAATEGLNAVVTEIQSYKGSILRFGIGAIIAWGAVVVAYWDKFKVLFASKEAG